MARFFAKSLFNAFAKTRRFRHWIPACAGMTSV